MHSVTSSSAIEWILYCLNALNLETKSGKKFKSLGCFPEANNKFVEEFLHWFIKLKICTSIDFNVLWMLSRQIKSKSLNSLAFKKLKNKGLKFINFKKVNISSSKLRKIW